MAGNDEFAHAQVSRIGTPAGDCENASIVHDLTGFPRLAVHADRTVWHCAPAAW
jgi:hypothetical protein